MSCCSLLRCLGGWIPRNLSSSEAYDVTHAASSGHAPPSILVVDDELAVCKVVGRFLQRNQQFEVETASSAAEARERLAHRAFDVVVTDVIMPGEDGLQLLQWGRQSCPETCWIVLTGQGTMEGAVQALKLGAFDFITKPVAPATLRKAVENGLKQQSLQRERDQLYIKLEERNRRLGEHVRELQQACALLEEQAQTIEADLRRAALIQRALLPRVPPATQGVSVHSLYRPSHIVGGDVYDVVRLDPQHLALLIADAAGHGLSAAMLAVLFRNRLTLVDPETGRPHAPGRVLESANRSLLQDVAAPGLFLTAVYCLVDTTSLKLRVASAGHPPLILQRASGAIERLFHTGPALGLYENAMVTEEEAVLGPGDRLLLHTDGLYDRLGSDAQSASDAVVERLHQSGPPAVSRDEDALLRDLAAMSEADSMPPSQDDDIALLSLRVGCDPSRLDNGEPLPISVPATFAPKSGCEVLVGRDAQRVTLTIRGVANWVHGPAVHEACSDALDRGIDVVIDLTLCQQLDSTLLGTIHELATRAESTRCEFRIQGVLPPVKNLFAELGMTRMLDHMVPFSLPLPTEMHALSRGSEDPETRWRRVLCAHESLAVLNERNWKEFEPVVTRLKKELALQ